MIDNHARSSCVLVAMVIVLVGGACAGCGTSHALRGVDGEDLHDTAQAAESGPQSGANVAHRLQRRQRKQDDEIRRALPDLVKMYIFADAQDVRQAAYGVIIMVGIDRAPRAVADGALAGLEKARSVKAKLASLMLLAQVGPPAKSAVPALLKLSRANPVWQDQVVHTLGYIGCAPGVVPELLRAQDTDEGASISAAAEADIALGRLQVREGIPVMHQHLASRHESLRAAAAKGLGLMGPLAHIIHEF
jgi:HEAT repeat protein